MVNLVISALIFVAGMVVGWVLCEKLKATTDVAAAAVASEVKAVDATVSSAEGAIKTDLK